MKRRRNAAASCEECEMDFESNGSLEKHLWSRNHKQRMLALCNLSWLDFKTSQKQHLFHQEINSSQHLPDDDCFSEDMDEYEEDMGSEDMGVNIVMINYALTMNRTATSFTHSPARCFSSYIATRMVL